MSDGHGTPDREADCTCGAYSRPCTPEECRDQQYKDGRMTSVADVEARARALAALIEPYLAYGKIVPLDLEMAMGRLVEEAMRS